MPLSLPFQTDLAGYAGAGICSLTVWGGSAVLIRGGKSDDETTYIEDGLKENASMISARGFCENGVSGVYSFQQTMLCGHPGWYHQQWDQT